MTDNRSSHALTPTTGRFLGYYVHRSVPAASDDVDVVVSDRWQYRGDLLALDVYGDEGLWPAVAVRNGLEDPVFGLVTGMTITLPSRQQIAKAWLA